MAYRVVTGFEDTETGVFYDIHTNIEDDNKNIKKYLKAKAIVKDEEEKPKNIPPADDEIPVPEEDEEEKPGE